MDPAEPLRLPPRPGVPTPPPFPVVGTVAPVGASLLMWAVTGSPLALVFGALGPVLALGTLLDGARLRRAAARRSAEARQRALDRLRLAIGERHSAARAAAWRRTPSAASIIAGGTAGTSDAVLERARWPSDARHVALGTGTVSSGMLIGGEADDDEERTLVEAAALLACAPVLADPAAGIRIVGPEAVARAVARAVVVQLADGLAPAVARLEAKPPGGWEWAAALPHASGRPARSGTRALIAVSEPGAADEGTADIRITTGSDRGAGATACATVIRVTGAGDAHVVRSAIHASGLRFRAELVTEADAARFAARLAAEATRDPDRAPEALPDAVAWAELASPAGRFAAPGTLSCPLGTGSRGAVMVDLVADGPHAIIGGTTGSGKSELLVTWVAAMAWCHPPERVTFLLVDFKGGAAFAPLSPLRHCVGVITDLAEGEAQRALTSLRAEMAHRERVIRDAGARDIDDPGVAGRLPRLVIVVDEFQAMLESFPDLHALFVALAARGRSLGIHLILCTQRPAGVVRDALLANCSLRMSLRVNNRADSQAVLGADDAAAIERSVPGRCLIRSADDLEPCQVASTAAADIRRLAERDAGSPAPRRPWQEPLPTVIRADTLPRAAVDDSTGALLGVLDEPDGQRYRLARYDARRDGHLLVLGAAGSGKSTLLAALARIDGRMTVVPGDVEAAWDALADPRTAGDAARAPEGSTLLLDDFDAVFGRWEPEYQLAATDLLAGLLRDGDASGVRVVLAMERVPPPLRPVLALCPLTLLLRFTDRDAYRAAGGVDELFDAGLPPGAGLWRHRRIQLVQHARPVGETDGGVGAAARATQPIAPEDPLIVVSGSLPRTTARLVAAGSGIRIVDVGERNPHAGGDDLDVVTADAETVFVGDPDAWRGQWRLFAALRKRRAVLFDRCSLADVRLLTGSRQLPPALAPGRGHAWLVSTGNDMTRAALPPAGRPSSQ